MLKQKIKRVAQLFAARFGLHNRTHSEPQLLILMYHRVLPGNDQRTVFEEPGMTVTPQTFKNNLSLLSDYFEFVSLSDWIERKNNGQALPPKACAITFDDGWADNYEFAYPILREAKVPATIFVVANMIGTNKQFWPERLARLLYAIAIENPQYWQAASLKWLQSARTDFTFSSTPPTREQISQIVAHAKQNSDYENHARLDQINNELNINTLPSKASLLSWAQLKEMTAGGLVEVGSHTCNHIRLDDHTPLDILESEILNSQQHIEKHIGMTIKTFCFPNGDYSLTALEHVRQNYLGAVSTANGWNGRHSDIHLLRRIGIHEDISHEKAAFLARISGWL